MEQLWSCCYAASKNELLYALISTRSFGFVKMFISLSHVLPETVSSRPLCLLNILSWNCVEHSNMAFITRQQKNEMKMFIFTSLRLNLIWNLWVIAWDFLFGPPALKLCEMCPHFKVKHASDRNTVFIMQSQMMFCWIPRLLLLLKLCDSHFLQIPKLDYLIKNRAHSLEQIFLKIVWHDSKLHLHSVNSKHLMHRQQSFFMRL